jgi:site-specific recombinase XerD
VTARADVEGVAVTCRHTYASRVLRAVPDLFELARVLGHARVRITELYRHLLPGHLERSRNAVNLPASPEKLTGTWTVRGRVERK